MGTFGGALINNISNRNAFKESRFLLCYELKRKKKRRYFNGVFGSVLCNKKKSFLKNHLSSYCLGIILSNYLRITSNESLDS